MGEGTCFSTDTLGRQNDRRYGDLVGLSTVTMETLLCFQCFLYSGLSSVKVLFWILRLWLPSLGTKSFKLLLK